MGYFSFIQTFWASDVAQISQVARLSLTSDGTDRHLWLHDVASHTNSSLTLSEGIVSAASFQHTTVGASQSLRPLAFDGSTRFLDQTLVDQVLDGTGAVTSYFDRVGFYGNMVNLGAVTVSGSNYLYVASPTGTGLSVYLQGPDETLSFIEAIPDTAFGGLGQITGLATGTVLGYDTVVTVSGSADMISLFYVGTDGSLSFKDDIGAQDRLPINAPTAVELLTVDGTTYVIVAAQDTHSVSLLSVGRNGAMEFLDQVTDTAETRFAGASALATTVWEGVGLIAVAGTDGGVSLFQLLPNGRLVLRDTFVDQLETALTGVAQLEFVTIDGSLQLVALATGDAGLTRLRVDLPGVGSVGTLATGTAFADVLTAPLGAELVDAGAGDDIVIDAGQPDQLRGGADADLFVFSPDGHTDTILDFDPATDRIDLSAYHLLYDISDIEITEVDEVLRLDLGDEELLVFLAAGTTLSPGDITNEMLFNANHVSIPDPVPLQGSAANDMFYWSAGSAGLINGGDGFDTIDYSAAPLAIVVALDGSRQSDGAATGDSYEGIERIIATGFDDVVIGNHLANMIEGNAGDDTLWGNSGNDWLVPGSGSDLVQGGPGVDMVSYVDSARGISANLGTGLVNVGGTTDSLTSIESLTGSIFGDYIVGSVGDNRLRGLGDYDWMVGSGGADSFDGGMGRDMVSYVASPTAVTVHLGEGQGLAGQAMGDTYVGIERITGSVHSDLIYGSAGADDFRGLGGFDWFVGSAGGKDRYDGGSGRDTVAYTDAPSGVVASLLLGRGSTGQAQSDLYTSIENLTGSSFADQLTGDHQSNILRGMWGADHLVGNGGNDRLTGGGSDDFLDGGSGWDYAYFSGAASDYTISQSNGVTYVDRIAAGGDGKDQLINIEVLVFADGDVYL